MFRFEEAVKNKFLKTKRGSLFHTSPFPVFIAGRNVVVSLKNMKSKAEVCEYNTPRVVMCLPSAHAPPHSSALDAGAVSNA